MAGVGTLLLHRRGIFVSPSKVNRLYVIAVAKHSTRFSSVVEGKCFVMIRLHVFSPSFSNTHFSSLLIKESVFVQQCNRLLIYIDWPLFKIWFIFSFPFLCNSFLHFQPNIRGLYTEAPQLALILTTLQPSLRQAF